jgi:hypothetical protein
VLAQPEPEPLREAYCTECASRIFNKTEIVKDTNGLFFQIALTAEEVDEKAEIVGVKPDGKGVDSKVPAVKVFLDRRCFDLWKGCR